jgi:hypothetical protein
MSSSSILMRLDDMNVAGVARYRVKGDERESRKRKAGSRG